MQNTPVILDKSLATVPTRPHRFFLCFFKTYIISGVLEVASNEIKQRSLTQVFI